ncbi:hypothetical protein [Acetobacter orientalis]|uniref:hypothetical protein n=1 Tax=Acetobacter orientalis TaxID=146474 RepID=UPI0039EA1406
MLFSLIFNNSVVQIADEQFPVSDGLVWVDVSEQKQVNVGYVAKQTAGVWSFTAPEKATVTLQSQASALLKTQQAYVMQNYAIYGEDTPPEWLVYLKELRAIASGTDTTSVVLPTAPTS